jgi:hypothetical protein
MAGDSNLIKSYLVGLGFKIDDLQFNKFRWTLESAEKRIAQHTSGMSREFLKFGGAAVGAYTAIGSATVGLLDKIAKGDLGYQLYAQHMYMSVDAAKKLKIATDALGYSINDISWNPELRSRFKELERIQTVMQASQGGDFQANMRRIRDIRFEFTKFSVEGTYLLQNLANALFKSFGTGPDDLLKKLKDWNEWIETHLDEISDKITTYLNPILKDMWSILKDLWSIGGDVTDVISDFLGLFSDDKGIRTSANSLENFGAQMDSLSHRFKDFIHTVRENEDIAGMIFGAMVGGKIAGPWGAAAGAIAGGAAGAWERHKYFRSGEAYQPSVHLTEGARKALGLPAESPPGMNMAGVHLPIKYPDNSGADPSGGWLGIPGQESGGNYNAVNPQSGALGKYQIMPQNWPEWAKAAGLQPNAPMTPENQDTVFRSRWGYYMKEYGGDQRLAAAAWYGGEGAANRLQRGDMTALNIGPRNGWAGPNIRDYINQSTSAFSARGMTTQNFHASVGDIHIVVNGTNLSAEEIGNAVIRRVEEAQDRANQRLQLEVGGIHK